MSQLNDLQHVRRYFRNGKSQVIVLNTGALIGPEAEAMLQALHSRSIGGFDSHFLQLVQKGAEKFMSKFYVGYDHKSIGDCGSATIFIEGVSMLAAKAVQDCPLYSGQEASTRYIDFSRQEFIDPACSERTKNLLELQRALYLHVLGELEPHLLATYPRNDGEGEAVYKKAIGARAFDIARSLLPSGASTNLAWHSNLRQIADHLMLLRHHPLKEVRDVAEAIEDAVLEAYPSSFGHKRYEATEKYNTDIMQEYYYEQDELTEFTVVHDGISRELLESYEWFLRNRPPKTELPRKINECGMLVSRFPLDFGSFRDIQRHRAVVQQMPLVTTRHGIEPWYVGQMASGTAAHVVKEMAAIIPTIDSLPVDYVSKQYYVPMGCRLPNQLSGGLHSLVYLAELRASSTVHPTLQIQAQRLGKELRNRFKDSGLVIYTDDDPGRFDIKRGEHDIVERDSLL